MSSRLRDLADFLRDDQSISCGVIEGAEDTDPYRAAAKRILFQVHQSELPVGSRETTASPEQVRSPARS